MGRSGRYKPYEYRSFPAWTSRRVAEDIDEEEAIPLNFYPSDASFVQTVLSKSEIVGSKQAKYQPSVDITPCSFPILRARFQPISVSLPIVSASTQDNLAENTRQSRSRSNIRKVAPSPQSHPNALHKSDQCSSSDVLSEERWFRSDEGTRPRKAGQVAVLEGQLGKWHCINDKPYSSQKTWFFAPIAQSSRKRKKKRKARPKHKTHFLSLPGELRNQIYAMLIPETRILIVSNRPNKELQRAEKIWSEQGAKHERPRPRLSHLLDKFQIEQGLAITQNLLRVNRQVRNEVELFLYSRTTFCFSSMKVLHKFLNTASKPGLGAIEKVEILHKGYGNPELLSYHKFRNKYYKKWATICEEIGEKLSGLRHLKIAAQLYDWPCQLSAPHGNSEWWRACLQMAPKRLPKVEAKLCHPMIADNEMLWRELGRRLENEMMTEQGQLERDRRETELVLKELAKKQATREAKAKARLAKLNAPTELTIAAEDIKKQKSSPVKVCNKDLEKYSRVDTVDMCWADLRQFKDQYCSQRHKTPS